ncbi:hypothetical protein FZ041_04175 [Selenomonas caprae]|uniref:PucR family transcriptional regulator n=1 Tax=Selenomonas caprae TaxID=2606905 RepID=A0A5D6WRP8_9FIRM|nr:helix-turn-helix domain-containing protein [Selenomonas caprae]TYZ29789.1 hypothetical protein FZ041_04175 [Selenomonas caprae]
MNQKMNKEDLWQQTTLQGKLRLAAERTGLELAVIDQAGELVQRTAGFAEGELSRLRNRRQALLQQDMTPFAGLFLVPISYGTQSLGWLVTALGEENLTSGREMMLKELSRHLSFLLWHEEEMRQETRRHREQFLYDVFYHNFESSEEVIYIGTFWNMDLDRPHYVVVAEFDQPLLGGRSKQWLDDLEHGWQRVLLYRFTQPITMQLSNQVILLLPVLAVSGIRQASAPQQLQHAAELIRKAQPQLPPFSLGIGRVYPAVADICRSLQEARQAVSLGRFHHPENGVTCYEELGVLKLLSHIRTEELDDFVQDILGPLMAYDDANKTDYLRTLEIYFQENESLPQAAERMFIHANTLRNRLKKIQDVLGVDLGRADRRVRFYVACQAMRIIQRQ